MTERQEEQRENQQDGQGYRQQTVFLDLRGITHGNHGATRQMDFHLRAGGFHRGFHIIEECHHTAVVLRLAGTKGGSHHHHRPLHIGGEDIAVVLLEALFSRGALQLSHHWCEEIQRITLHILNQQSAGRKHQHLLVLLQLGSHIVGLLQQTVHPLVILRRQEVGNMLIYEGGYLLYFRDIHLRHNVAHHPRRIPLFQRGRKGIDGRHHHVWISLCGITILEQGIHLVCTRDVLIDLQGMLMPAVEGQKV